LGGRTTIRMMVRGATPGRAIVAGVGWDGVLNAVGRGTYFRHILTNLGSFERGTAEWMAEAFLKTVGGDPVALLNVLETFVDTPRDALSRVNVPTLVLMGADDHDTGSGRDLAAALPRGQYAEIPGNHMSAVTKAELGMAIAESLGPPAPSRPR
jgi:pimeloyl-ACP methyl ester carboxylesterase